MADVRKLKDEAAKAVEKGRHRRAAEIYVEVSQAEREDPLWPHRAGEAFKRAGMATEAIRHLSVAAEGYVRQGFLLKAISVAKMILEIDPRRTETQAMLAGLYARRESGSNIPAVRPPDDRGPPVAAVLPQEVARTIEPLLARGDSTPAGGHRLHRGDVEDVLAISLDDGGGPSELELFGDDAPEARAPSAAPDPTIPIVLAMPDDVLGADARLRRPRDPLPLPTAQPPAPPTADGSRPPDPTIPIVLALPDDLQEKPRPSVPVAVRSGVDPFAFDDEPSAPSPPSPPPRAPDLDADDDWSDVSDAIDAPEPLSLDGEPAAAPPPDPLSLLNRPATPPPSPAVAVPARAPTPPPAPAPSASLAAEDRINHVPLKRVIPGSHISQDFDDAFEIPIEDVQVLEEPRPASLPRIPLFSSLDERQLRHLIEQSRIVRFAAGETIVRQGDLGSSLFVIVKGEVEITIEGVGPPVNYLREGAFFGEMAALTEWKRMATVIALDEVELLEIGRDVIRDLARHSPDVMRVLLRFFRERLIERLIATSQLFAPFSGEESRLLAERFQFLEFEPGAVIIREGERSGGLFVMLCGEAAVTTLESGQIALIAAGDVVGEMSLLTRAPAMATVHARSRVWALGLPRNTFQELILTHPQVLIFVNELAESRRQKVSERLSLF